QLAVFGALTVRAEILHVDKKQRRLFGNDRYITAERLNHRPYLPDACSSSTLGEEAIIGLQEQARQSVGPGLLAVGIGDQVLPYLQLEMRKSAALAVHGDGVVAFVADRVWLVVADDEIALRTQQIQDDAGEETIAVIEHADMPRPRRALERGCETVHRDQNRRQPLRSAAIELCHDAVVIGCEDL